MKAFDKMNREINVDLKKVEFRGELSNIADRVYSDSSFVFYKDEDSNYYAGDNGSDTPRFIGDLNAVNAQLEFFARMEDEDE